MSRTKTRGGNNAALRRTERAEHAKEQAIDNKKRKREDNSSEHPAKKIESNTNPAANRPEQTSFDATIATASSEDLATRYREAIKKRKGDLSTIELEDVSLPPSVFEDTTRFDRPRIVTNLAEFLNHITPGGKKELSVCKAVSSPHTLVVTTSAIRATDLVRAVREFGTEDNKIAKLFAKHQKLKEMLKYVQKTSFGIGAGTGGRIKDLIEADALKLDELQRVIIDASYIDDKQNTIFNHPEGFEQLQSLLNTEKLNLRLHSGSTKIMVF